MSKPKKARFLESDLYQPVCDFLTRNGYKVHAEVKDCDIAAVRDDELIVVELKRGFNASLLLQAVKRQKASDAVYVAIPKPSRMGRAWADICHLLKRLELGLILVTLRKKGSDVDIVFHPSIFDLEKNKKKGVKKRQTILREIDGRHGNYNLGGSSQKKIMTAYKENAIFIASCLEKFGPMAPRDLRSLGTGSKTQSILTKNFYDWYEKTGRGLYGISQKGIRALKEFPKLVKHYHKEIKQKSALFHPVLKRQFRHAACRDSSGALRKA
jgi:hypothetical protein